jgi:hypothetical protein
LRPTPIVFDDNNVFGGIHSRSIPNN